jgi:DNA primase catalytic core
VSKLIDEFDSNFENEGGIRHAIVDIIESRRSEIPTIRMVEEETLFQVAERALESNTELEPDVRYFAALREVTNFITFATEGAISDIVAKHADLLPVSHPNSKESAVMTASAQRMLRAEWLAADLRITDENVRSIVASVYASNPLSVDYAYHLSRLESLDEGQVPADLLIQPLLAFGDPYAGKNSFWHRSMRAKKQRRDDEGQFAEMGGGYRFYVRDIRGRVFSVVGKVAGIPENDPLGIDIEVSGVEGIRDGIYTIPAAAGHAFKAILPEHAVSKRIRISGDNLNAIDLSSLTRKELPTSWFATKKSNDNTNLDNKVKADRFFATGDGYIANLYNKPDEELGKRIAEAQNKFGALVSSDQGTDTLNPDKPVYELISTKRGQPEVVGYSQDWAALQKFASDEDENYPEAENEPVMVEESAAKKPKEAPVEIAVAPESMEELASDLPSYNPSENVPTTWYDNGDNTFYSVDGKYVAKFGPTDIAADYVYSYDPSSGQEDLLPTGATVSDAFAIYNTDNGSAVGGVSFDWNGVSDAIDSADQVEEMASPTKLDPENLDPERAKYIEPDANVGGRAGANEPISDAQKRSIYAAIGKHEVAGGIADIWDEMVANDWQGYTFANAMTLLIKINESPERPGGWVKPAQIYHRKAMRDSLRNRNVPEEAKKILLESYKSMGESEIKAQITLVNTFPAITPDPRATLDGDRKPIVAPVKYEPGTVSAETARIPKLQPANAYPNKFPPRAQGVDRDGKSFYPLLNDLKGAFSSKKVSEDMVILFDDMITRPSVYSYKDYGAFMDVLNKLEPTEKKLATTATRALVDTMMGMSKDVPGDLQEKLKGRRMMDHDEINALITELVPYVPEYEKIAGRAKTAQETAESKNLASATPKYLGTDLTAAQSAPKPMQLVMLESLIENKDFSDPAAKKDLDTLIAEHRTMPYPLIQSYIKEFQQLPYKAQFQPNMLHTTISREDGGPTPRMLRSLERSRIKGLIGDEAWNEITKNVPTMLGQDIATRYIISAKDLEDKYDDAVLARSIENGYEINGLRVPAKSTVTIPEDYTPSKPGVWLGSTEDEINAQLDLYGATKADSAPSSAMLNALKGLNSVLKIRQYESTLEANDLDDFLQREVLRADLTRTRRAMSGVAAQLADLLESSPSTAVRADSAKILRGAIEGLTDLRSVLNLRRTNVLTKKEVDKRLSDLAIAILPGDGSPSPLGTLKNKTPESLEVLARAQAAVGSLIGLYKQGGSAPVDQDAVEESSASRKPSMQFFYPPTFAGEGLDPLRGMSNFNDVVQFLKNNDIYVLDLETTGLTDLDDFEIKNDPIQIAVTKISGLQAVDSFSTYINPQSKISSYTLKNVGDGKGGRVTQGFLSDFPTKRDAMAQLKEFIPNGAIVAGHNSTLFDMEVINRTIAEAGLEPLEPSGMIDTLGFARYIMPEWTPDNPDAPFKINARGEQAKSFSLEALVNYFGLSNNGRHEADADVNSTVEVFQKMLDRASRGLAVGGREFSYNASDNDWNYDSYVAAEEAYKQASSEYILSRVGDILSLEGMGPEQINSLITSMINNIQSGVTSGQEQPRSEVNIPATNPLKDLPAGSYVYDNSTGRVGISMGIVENRILVDFPTASILANGLRTLEKVLPESLVNATRDFLSSNGVYLDYGMQVKNPDLPGGYGYVLSLSGDKGGNIYAGSADYAAQFSAKSLEVVPTTVAGDKASDKQEARIINLVDEVVSAGIMDKAMALPFQRAAENHLYGKKSAGDVIMRLTTSLNQFRQLAANSDIQVEAGENAAPQIEEMAAPKKPKDTKKIEDIEFSKALEKALKSLDIQPTPEGKNIIGSVVNNFFTAVMALAGVGKTTNLRLTAQAIMDLFPQMRILYAVFNKENQMEALEKMPDNTEARTSDSISVRANANTKLRAKMDALSKQDEPHNMPVNFFREADIADLFGVKDVTLSTGKEVPRERVAGIASAALRSWILSDSMKIDASTIDAISSQMTEKEMPRTAEDYRPFIRLVQMMWDDVISDHDQDRRQLVVNFNHLFKNWALTRPDLTEVDGSGKSIHGLTNVPDFLFLDEAQDINPVFRKVIQDQYTLHKNGIVMIAVGDNNQAIFGFRGAEDALNIVKRDLTLPLTKSYRTGQTVLDAAANKLLGMLGESLRLQGKDGNGTKLVDSMSRERIDLALSRGTAAILKEAITVEEMFEGGRIATTLNFKQELLNMLKAMTYLQRVDYVNYANAEARKNDPNAVPILPPKRPTIPGALLGLNWETMYELLSEGKGDQSIQQIWNVIRGHASKNKIKIGPAMSDLLNNIVPNLRVVNHEFHLPAELDPIGSLGGGLDYEITKDKIIVRDDPSAGFNARKTAISGIYNNRKVLEDYGFFNPSKDQATGRYGAFEWEINLYDDGRDQLQDLVKGLRGEDAMFRIMTGHTSKGLEADNVKILDDWLDLTPFLPGGDAEKQNELLNLFRSRGPDFDLMEEIRLMYVVTTRPRTELDLGGLKWLNNHSPEQLKAAVDEIQSRLAMGFGAVEENVEVKSPEEIEAIKNRPTGEERSGLPPRTDWEAEKAAKEENSWRLKNTEERTKEEIGEIPRDGNLPLKPRSRDNAELAKLKEERRELVSKIATARSKGKEPSKGTEQKLADVNQKISDIENADSVEESSASKKRPTSPNYQDEFDQKVGGLKAAIATAKDILNLVPEDRTGDFKGYADTNIEETIGGLQEDLDALLDNPDMLERDDEEDYRSSERLLAKLNADKMAKLEIGDLMEARRIVKNKGDITGTDQEFVYGNTPPVYLNRVMLDALEKMKDSLYRKLDYDGKLDWAPYASGQVEESSSPVEGVSPEMEEKLYNIVEEAAKFYSDRLMNFSDPGATEAKKYVVSRGFSAANAETFKIGYSSKNWADLYQHLRRKGFSEEEILASGLVNRSENNGRLFDSLRNRIVFPVSNEKGRVVGFVGRSIDPEESIRYMRTKGTPIFQKSSTLFGLDQARDAIAESGEMVVVEGQFDVLAMHAGGIKNTIAASGTAFGEGHMDLFNRIVGDKDGKSVVFAFDPDDAGIRAAGQVFSMMSDLFPQITPYIVSDESGLDPADIYSKDNENGLKTLMDNKRPMAEALIERLLSSGRDISEIRDTIVSILRNINDLNLQNQLVERFGPQLGENMGELFAEVRMSGPDRNAKYNI